MYERFTDKARKAMALANQEAQRFNHEYIGTEHILLGIVKEGSGVGANVLKDLDIDLKKVRLAVEKLIESGPEELAKGRLLQTPGAKKAIEYAIEEARDLNAKFVGTEHMLLGLLRDEEGEGSLVLIHHGLKLEEIRDEVLKRLDRPVDEPLPADRSRPMEEFGVAPLVLLLDPGTASAEEIGQLLFEFSTLYRMLGGSGITFTLTDARDPALA